jgi:hypothetical protein
MQDARQDHLLGAELPACTCRHPGPLREELLATSPHGTRIRLTCQGCEKTRDFDVPRDTRTPRFLA